MNTSFSFDSQPNAAKLINSLRHLGYNNYSALADLVDNSMDADATNVYIHVRQRGKEPEIIIADDGSGMNSTILGEAIKLGSETSKNEDSDLGKFGMGLCTATLSIARTTVVLTKTEDGLLLKAINDVEEVIKQGKFRSFLGEPTAEDVELFNEVTNGASQGTVVILRNCDNLSNRNLSAFSGTLGKDIARIFRYFIDAGKKIFLNGKQVDAYDPLEWHNPLTQQFDESDLEITLEDSVENIHIKMAILADNSAMGEKETTRNLPNQGFYVMRNNREMMHGQTLDLFTKHNDLNRMRIELSFSGKLDKLMGVNFTKKNLNLVQSMEDKLKNYFEGQITTIRKRCKRQTTTDTPEEINTIHSDVSSEIRKKSKLLMTPSAPKEIRSRNDEKEKENDLKGVPAKTRNPSPDRQQQGGFVADGEFKSAAMGVHGIIYEAEQIGRKIVVTYNSDHPFYSRFILEQGRNDKRIVAGVDYLIYSLACAELKQNIEDDNVNELIGNFKTIMSVNLRTLLS